MHDDVYQMYLEEIGILTPCTPDEEAALLERVKSGDAEAKNRLMEGTLGYIVELVKAYENQGLPLGDLVQEANIAVMMALGEPENLNFEDSGEQEGLTAFRSYISRWKQLFRKLLQSRKVLSRLGRSCWHG